MANTRPAKPKAVEAADEDRKVIALTTSEDEVAVDRVELFSIDGESFTVPVKVAPSFGMRYARIARKQGVELAADYMLETLLTTEGYEALMDYLDTVSEEKAAEVLELVMEACSQVLVGASRGKH
jgi:hypothetical protein